MKKFKFSMESVLKVRTLHKKIAERELATTQSRLNHNRIEQEKNQEAYADTFRLMQQSDTHHAFWSQLALRYQQGLLIQREQLQDEQDKLIEKLEGEKKALTRKMREEMVMEKLKDYQEQEHKRLADAEEQAEIEEIDVLKRGNKS